MDKENDHSIPDEVEIAGETLPETVVRTQAELARRERLEKVRRQRDSFADLNELAEFETKQSGIFLKECKTILAGNLAAGVKFDWASLYNDSPFPPFVYKKPAPQYNKIVKEAGVPQKNFLSELLLPSVKNTRLQKENEARAAYGLEMKRYEEDKEAGRAAYDIEKEAYVAGQSAYNSKVEGLQLAYEKGQPAAVRSFARMILNGMKMPDTISVYFDAVYLPGEKQLVIDCLLPAYYDLPRAVSCQYKKEDGAIVPDEMEEHEFDAFYLDLIRQIALAAINTAFNMIHARLVAWVGFNGWIENDKTGDDLETKACVITCGAARNVFTALDLLKNSPAQCIQELEGFTAKSFTGSDAVQPVVSAGPLSDAEDTKGKDGPKPPEYQPGEFKRVTTELVGEMLEQIEKNLLKAAGNKDGTIH